MIKTKFMVLVSLIVVFSCKNNTSYFNGEVTLFEGFSDSQHLKGKEIIFDSIHTGDLFVYDSIIGFLSRKYPDYYFSLFNLETGKHLMDVCKKGAGPNEFRSLDGFQQFEYINGDLCLWLREVSTEKLFLLNITQSFIDRTTRIDFTLPLIWTNPEFYAPYSFTYVLDDSTVISKNQAYKKDMESAEYIPPAYHLFNTANKTKKKEFVLYNEQLINKDRKSNWYGDYLHSVDRIKPDKSKIAMGMKMLCQVNVLDISSGELKGFRMKNTPDFNYFEKESEDDMKGGYVNLCVDDTYIYAVYSGKKRTEDDFSDSNEIHVFDWEGNPVKRLLLDQIGNNFRFDGVNKRLWISNYADEVFSYDVKELLYN